MPYRQHRSRNPARRRALAASAGGQAIGEERGIQRAGARAAHALDLDALILEQPVEHAPRERAVRAAALQGEVQNLLQSASRRSSMKAR